MCQGHPLAHHNALSLIKSIKPPKYHALKSLCIIRRKLRHHQAPPPRNTSIRNGPNNKKKIIAKAPQKQQLHDVCAVCVFGRVVRHPHSRLMASCTPCSACDGRSVRGDKPHSVSLSRKLHAINQRQSDAALKYLCCILSV